MDNYLFSTYFASGLVCLRLSRQRERARPVATGTKKQPFVLSTPDLGTEGWSYICVTRKHCRYLRTRSSNMELVSLLMILLPAAFG